MCNLGDRVILTCARYDRPVEVLNPSQIIRRFGFSRYIAFTMYLDIVHVYMHSKCNVSGKAKASYNLEKREY
jgi:hypothetical protein